MADTVATLDTIVSKPTSEAQARPLVAPRAPWLRLAVESRWRILAHLRNEQRESVRRFLEVHLRRLDDVIRDRRAA